MIFQITAQFGFLGKPEHYPMGPVMKTWKKTGFKINEENVGKNSISNGHV
ncbi:MAG: hypothetical protein OK457_07280 [Thaumarchaeota archaeon]|nr:hypothetical protein [Nitrososphaerota archaeon]